ncbi:deoxyribose-phosphate aldolase [Gilbertella persicaria]|uniref:deoxyribose-phosphate aldolase n=1 Tax=Gilbertella persicaria TaxID=101096 RepID=UPI002220C493|nr:deoxyribose-phosphate aldolase [Gilbertella persicaria]KAI8092163.1 deoxyribose-phosphate aldolase [Gilbertella persicaria]
MTLIVTESLTTEKLGKVFDHAILRPDQTTEDVIKGCEVAKKYNLASVCVKPCDVAQASELLKGTDVMVGTVISFPHGNSTTEVKIAESLQAIEDGAIELDVVLNIGFLRSGLYDKVQSELTDIIKLSKAKNPDVSFKIIFETAYLTKEQIVKACEISQAAGAHFVKTSTGFASAGATYEYIELMRASVPDNMEVKASGGIKTLEQVLKFLELGATRVGSSSSDQIVEEFKKIQQ